jgi:hypothetical protein
MLKVNLSMFVIKHKAMMACWGLKAKLHAFLTSAIVGGTQDSRLGGSRSRS